ncbi:MAG: 2Fe-2S iron-sulfur cluster binding domain-containing protein [Novosphingobium sp.]|nr:2Fe-2S iron-sulfur cluster binding domain-containing protein [Novosphingobium sp.]
MATPPATNSGGGATANRQPAANAEMSSMSSMMQDMMGGEDEPGGKNRQGPYFTQLLNFPALSNEEKQALARKANQRIADGLALIDAGNAAAMHAPTPQTRLDAARQLREGLDLLKSGAAAQAALQGEAQAPVAAQNWFREQLGIAAPAYDGGRQKFGVSPSHLLLMLFLGLVSASLIALQMLRLRRVRTLVGAASTASGHAEGAAASGLARTSTQLARTPGSPAPEPSPKSVAKPAVSPRSSKRWSGQLKVVQIVRETPTVQTFRLADPGSDRLPFDFLPGQFLQVEVTPEAEKTARRSYTIASSPTQRAYVELTVKREELGAVSKYLHDKLAAGDLLKVTGPFGEFTFTGTDAESIVLIAGGVGITPMMSVLRYLTDIAWPGQIFFLYGARSTEEFVFRDELERLERRFANLHVMAAMQRSAGTVWLGPEGPITKDLLSSAVPDIAKRRVHLCGPPGMMAVMREQLAELGVPEAQLHTEAFGPASQPADAAEIEVTKAPALAAAKRAGSKSAVAPTTVTFSISGVSAPLPADETVLEAAEEAGVEIPYACRVGECGVCVTKLLAGEVSMEVETGLAPEDKDKGYVLACQAKSTGQPLVVEA